MNCNLAPNLPKSTAFPPRCLPSAKEDGCGCKARVGDGQASPGLGRPHKSSGSTKTSYARAFKYMGLSNPHNNGKKQVPFTPVYR